MFDYLADKVRIAPFIDEPFRHVLIDDFFSDDHFRRIVESEQIRLPVQHSTGDLVKVLSARGYEPIEFPGCITDVDEYVAFADGKRAFNRKNIAGYGRDVIEGYGVTFRIKTYSDPFLADLMNFLGSEHFAAMLADKFGIPDTYSVDTGIQKNLRHYEISPHPDTSRKALTFMANIYTEDDFATKEMHTQFCRFRPEYAYVESFWRGNYVDPVWVPWHWAETVKRTNTNNSISIFQPSADTLHAVRVTEDHLTHQRNQIYGNLWYPKPKKLGGASWQEIDLPSRPPRSLRNRLLRRMMK